MLQEANVGPSQFKTFLRSKERDVVRAAYSNSQVTTQHKMSDFSHFSRHIIVTGNLLSKVVPVSISATPAVAVVSAPPTLSHQMTGDGTSAARTTYPAVLGTEMPLLNFMALSMTAKSCTLTGYRAHICR